MEFSVTPEEIRIGGHGLHHINSAGVKTGQEFCRCNPPPFLRLKNRARIRVTIALAEYMPTEGVHPAAAVVLIRARTSAHDIIHAAFERIVGGKRLAIGEGQKLHQDDPGDTA